MMMKGASARAEALLEEIPDSVMPGQFSNPANPEIHEQTTGREIWDDTNGEVDAIVAGVGHGGATRQSEHDEQGGDGDTGHTRFE